MKRQKRKFRIDKNKVYIFIGKVTVYFVCYVLAVIFCFYGFLLGTRNF